MILITNNNTLTIDTVKPTLQFISPTEDTNTNFSRNYIIANVSLSEINFANITFNLYNTIGLVNSTTYLTTISEIT